MRHLDLFRDSNSLMKMMDQMFEGPRFPTNDKYSWNPSCEAHEDANSYYLKFDLPGVPKDQIKIDLHDNRLTVTGERKEEKQTDNKESRTHFSEVYYGTFTRSMTFPTAVDAERAEAKFENGVLNITVMKKSNPGARQISIK